jgi:hypothetical protein
MAFPGLRSQAEAVTRWSTPAALRAVVIDGSWISKPANVDRGNAFAMMMVDAAT